MRSSGVREVWTVVAAVAWSVLAWSAEAGEAHQDFDNPGADYEACQYVSPPAAAVIGDPNKPSRGQVLRLATSPAVTHNGVVFAPWQPAACQDEVHVDFDFRITPVTGRADGLGLALVNTANYPATGCVAPQGPLFVAEEPNFAGSLGIGFDVYRNESAGELSNNHVSLHYNGAFVAPGEFQAVSDMGGGGWLHAHVRVRTEKGGARVRVTLKPFGQPEELVVDDVLVPGFAFHEWRVLLAGRSGGLSAHHDVDNFHVVSTGCPQLDGQWQPAVLDFGVVAIHAHLLPTGNVMYWDRHTGMPPGQTEPKLWDPVGGGITDAAMLGYDAFCAGHVLDKDGKLFVSGGHIVDNEGLKNASSYQADTDTWFPHPDMNAGRWYPTSTALYDGDILTVAGSYWDGTLNPDGSHHIAQNVLPQVFDTDTNTWRNLTTALKEQPLYPWMFQAPNGKVFDAGPQQQSRYLDTAGTGAWSNVALAGYPHRDYGSAVMDLPGRVLITGGTFDSNLATPTNSAETIDLSVPAPAWSNVAHMAYARRQQTATLLPDGTTLVTGGSEARFFNNSTGAVLHAELWDPGTQSWRTLDRGQEARLYHSTALLLPDARVLVAGGGHPSGGFGDPDHTTAEVFQPPYLFDGPRPVINALSATTLAYGQTFTVTTPDAAAITDVTFLRLGSVTHAFNQNQRFNRLAFQAVTGALQVSAPADPRLCPPGHYLLFILRDGVPSVASIVKIG